MISQGSSEYTVESGIWVQSSETYSNFWICTFIMKINKASCVLDLIPPNKRHKKAYNFF